MGREGGEQWHDQGQLTEELEAREVERDGHVRRAAPLVDLELDTALVVPSGPMVRRQTSL